MTLRQYLAIMMFGTLLCFAAWVFVLVNVDPFHANTVSFVFFYATLFFTLIGALSLGVFALYHTFSRTEEPLFRYVQKSFRDAFLLSLLVIGLLYLQGKGWLTMWNASMFIILILVASIFVMTMRDARQYRR